MPSHPEKPNATTIATVASAQEKRIRGLPFFLGLSSMAHDAVFREYEILVLNKPDSRSVKLVLFSSFEGGALLDFHAIGERTRRCLARLIETDDLRPVHRHTGRDLLVVLHPHFRRSGHDQTGPVAARAREPRAVVPGHLAAFVVINVFTEIEDVFRLLAHCEVIP